MAFVLWYVKRYLLDNILRGERQTLPHTEHKYDGFHPPYNVAISSTLTSQQKFAVFFQHHFSCNVPPQPLLMQPMSPKQSETCMRTYRQRDYCR